ncbi:hypothetical protein NM688_g2064 [Phlebia brevispora]|uniref:Uncharacterized protein n=1 Tax=Phlebia brevispora TaxID=194682 RepID=A0ACC1T9Y8_9APHY|nr:hypothetical protein NM688_g2064 [Phlebia brevispora]
MDGTVHSRGRGLKINGAARGTHSKNKQWIAGHGTIGPQSRESSTHPSNGERWERGGGPHRGRGRGRGSAWSTPHLTVPSQHEDATSGAEDEGQEPADAYNMEDEEMESEVEDNGPDDPAEREKFYQELVKAREVERKRAIAESKMDDPLVPKRLEDAITMVGTCMDMCPRFERYRRERENNLDRWEIIPGTKRVDHKRAVKIYERAAGDKVLPSDLRPPKVLKKTLDYLFHDLIPRGGFADTHDFVRDRSRSVRNDFTIQHDTGPIAIECHDRCARFHILALHLLRDKPTLSTSMELQQLMFTLQSLKEFYQDQRGRYSSPSELEMRVYHRLIHIRDQVERHDDIPEEISQHPVFILTTKFRHSVQAKSAPITKTSTLKVDGEGMQIFAELASVLREQNNVVMIYLVACIIEVLFGEGTVEGIEDIRGELSIPEIIDGISKPLAATEGPIKETPTQASLSQQPAVLAESQPFTQAPVSIFAPAPPIQQPAPFTAAPPQPPPSAFSNLTTKPNPFGGTASVFGGPVFGAPASTSAPKSVFGIPATSAPRDKTAFNHRYQH